MQNRVVLSFFNASNLAKWILAVSVYPAVASAIVWSSGPWSLQIVQDDFYGVGTGCKLFLDLGERRVSFSLFFLGGPVVVEGPELQDIPRVTNLVFADPRSNMALEASGQDDSTPYDGRIEMRLPSKVLMQAIEGFADLGTTSLIVEDGHGSFKMTLDITGLPEAAAEMRKCVDGQNLNL